jgi:hypothetical protein
VSFFANVLRSGDLLNFQLEFVNLVIDSTNPAAPRLRRETSGDAFIVLRLPPQHIAEDSLKSSGASMTSGVKGRDDLRSPRL